ncbi:hypothetical protein AB0G42_21455 [Streptomyces yangpuensis]|uniref:hypothetical protein n=1 Tax=Streptomyces yangpuensis TaxID=1648182 RepID=UPI003428FB90
MSDNPNPAGPDAENPKDGEPAEGTGTAPANGPESDDQGDGEPNLGDAGKKALKAERDARKTAEKKATELEAENARLRRSNAASKGTDLDAIKAEIRAEFAVQLAETAIKAEAKGRLADPADALLFIKVADVAEGDDAIEKAIDQLLKDRPYLAAANPGTKPWGDVGGGQRKAPEVEPRSPLERMARAYGSK